MFSQKIKTIENILNKFGTVIDIDKSKCVQLRSKRASCKDCISACPSSAINISNNEVDIDSEKCSECGICCKVCKTGVFKFKNLSETGFYDDLSGQSEKQGHVVLSCSKCKAAKEENTLTVPCLGWVDASVILWSVASGAKEIYLQYNDCKTCNVGCGFDAITSEIAGIQKLLGSYVEENNIKFTILNRTPLPACDTVQTPSEDEVLTRRGLFGYFHKRTKASIFHAVNFISETQQTHNSARADIIKKTIEIPVKKQMLTHSIGKLFPLLSKAESIAEYKNIGILSIDVSKCNLCGVCYKLCPTRALKEISEENAEGYLKKVGICFNSKGCVKCNLCVELCTAGAVSYRTNVTLSEYIDSQNDESAVLIKSKD